MNSAILWVILTLAAPPAAREVYRRAGSHLARWEADLAEWTQAAYGVVPLYGAWITGAVLGIDCGLYGFSPAGWTTGIAACALSLGALALGLRSASFARLVQAWFRPDVSWLVLFDEPRWAFYRGAAAVPLLSPVASQAVGLLLGGLEWLIRTGRPSRGAPPQVWSGLVRLGVSAALFAMTHNLWLTLLTQAVGLSLVRRSTTRRSTSS